MKKILKFTLFVALISIVGRGATLDAQILTNTLSIFDSPQSESTMNLVRSEADDFIRPDAYNVVDDWFAMASFRADNGRANIGYGNNLGDLYIAAYYAGTSMGGFNMYNYIEEKVDDWPGGPKTVPVFSDFNDLEPNTSNFNQLSLLLGIADMGFRLSFVTSHQGYSASNIYLESDDPIGVGDPVHLKSLEVDKGLIYTQLAWAMNQNLIDGGIRPNIIFGLGFNRDFQSFEIAVASNSPGTWILTSENYTALSFTLGLGGFDILTTDGGFRLILDLENTLNLRMYGNEYSYSDNQGKYQSKSINGLNNNGSLTEEGFFANTFTPYLIGLWGDDNFDFRFRFSLPIAFTSISSTEMASHNTSGDIRKQGDDNSSSSFTFTPTLDLGMQWRANSFLSVNAGGRIGFGGYSAVTTENEEFNEGNAVADTKTKSETKSVWGTTHSLRLGLTLNPYDFISFQAVTGISTGNSMYLFGNMATFSQFLVSLSF